MIVLATPISDLDNAVSSDDPGRTTLEPYYELY